MQKCLSKEENHNTCETSQALALLVGTGIFSFVQLLSNSHAPGTKDLCLSRVLTITSTTSTTTKLHTLRQRDLLLGLSPCGRAQGKPTPTPIGVSPSLCSAQNRDFSGAFVHCPSQIALAVAPPTFFIQLSVAQKVAPRVARA